MLRNPSDPHFGGLDSHVGLEATAHSATDIITIPDSDLLYAGDFKRAGNDLILSDDKQKFVVHDYFKFDKHPTLVSPRGGTVTPDVVLALAGSLAPGQYAQATQPKAQAQPIGRVVTVTGKRGRHPQWRQHHAEYRRRRPQGRRPSDRQRRQARSDFNDGATFDLGANARIVLTEFVYDQNGAENSSVVNLIRGQLDFIAGQIAHTGDMKVVTPVATMGIRGTVGIVAYGDSLSLTVANENDGQVHSIEIRNNNGDVIGHATSVGGTWNVTAATAAEGARQTLNDLAVVQQLLNLQTIGQQIIQQLQNDAKSTQHAGSSSTYQVTVEKATDTTSKVTSTTTTTTTTVDSSGTTKDTTVVDQLQEFIPTVNNSHAAAILHRRSDDHAC